MIFRVTVRVTVTATILESRLRNRSPKADNTSKQDETQGAKWLT
jgi:hypothetical protein